MPMSTQRLSRQAWQCRRLSLVRVQLPLNWQVKLALRNMQRLEGTARQRYWNLADWHVQIYTETLKTLDFFCKMEADGIITQLDYICRHTNGIRKTHYPSHRKNISWAVTQRALWSRGRPINRNGRLIRSSYGCTQKTFIYSINVPFVR